jgi:two-component system chemotaxis response regulator CheY
MPKASSLKVLVVDDQQTMRGIARQILKRLGIVQVELAANGEAALEVMKSKKFDAIISDLNMPEMDGAQLAEQVKAHPVLKATPFFLATSEKYHGEVDGSNIDHFVTKPFSVTDLKAAFESKLGSLN